MFFYFYLLFFLILSKNAFAYLDPGTFSIIGTVIASVLAGISGGIIFLRTKIKSFFKKINQKNNKK